MKKQIIRSMVLSIMGVAAAQTGLASEICRYYGNETISSIDCVGLATLNGTTVLGNVHVIGSLKANSAKMDSLTLTGTADLSQRSEVRSYADVIGALSLTQSIIGGPVTIYSNTPTPYLYLFSSSHINNSVTFSGVSGVVKEEGGSTVSGQINNGKADTGSNGKLSR